MKTQTAATTLPFSSMTDEEVRSSLSEHRIGLTVEEARAVEKMLKRPPTLVEAVIWGIQGSEHCSYKSSRRFLRAFPTTGKHVILGPKEDSGIVALTDGPVGERWGIVVSHESHNHPSQVVPFEGAATGVGGTVRDVVCMGARVVGCMDMLRLGDLQTEETRAIAKEVARGIAGYGNPLGIPNLGGDTVFDAGYNSNCLVNAIAIGIVREDEIIHSYVPEEAGEIGYDIIIVGKPTDRSGFGGASFASASMEESEREENAGAVQEPNPFLERHLLASTYALFDWLAAEKLLSKVSFKDLGAGGVVCSSVEQVAERGLGADIALERVHVSLPDLPPEVIACAETQERFCWIIHPDLTERVLKHYNEEWDLPSIAENARASVIGKVTTDGVYRLTHHGTVVCSASAKDITSGLQYQRPTADAPVTRSEPDVQFANGKVTVAGSHTFTLAEVFRTMLHHPNHASKAPFVRHYDKTVIGNTVVEAGEADATVIVPLQDLEGYQHTVKHPGWTLSPEDRTRGAVFAADGNPRYGRISAYWQGVNAAVESMCNVAAVGGSPRALTDCLNYGNPEVPEQLRALEEGVRGIADAAKGVTVEGECVPVISGNVSLYNATPDGRAIPPSAIVCCIGMMRDAHRAVTMQVKEAGSVLLLIGGRDDACGGSAYYEVLEQMSGLPADALLGNALPQPDFNQVSKQIALVTEAIGMGIVRASHDISDGGLLLALFEMLLPQRKIGGALGIDIDLATLESSLPADRLLFSQAPGFILGVSPADAPQIRERAERRGVATAVIGSVTNTPMLHVKNGVTPLLKETLSPLITLWESGLTTALDPGSR
ncbi:MAG: phosphoribosylformylglycinamidine synthase subunit PurL [Candidatus Peregrinibacteria bacterium]|nr:phosphoribosylformylglycinamidine synthase subunit PurL [Candidatus Peregrinibacteria bacterium]